MDLKKKKKKSKIKTPADRMSGQGPLPGLDSCLFPISSHVRKGEGALWGLSHKGVPPINEGSILMILSPSKGHTS